MNLLKLDRAKGSYGHALVITDFFTEYFQAHLTKNKSAKSTSNKLYKITNQFTDFLSKYTMIWRKTLQLSVQFAKNNTIPSHGDGQTGRMNRTITNRLKTLNDAKKSR